MPISRRKRFSLWATLGYAVFAALWIFLSDRVLATFSDVTSITHFSTLKGLFFILVTALTLWLTLRHVPDDAEAEQQAGNSRFKALVEQSLAGIYIV